MNDIWRSKEFWTGVVGGIATLAVYFVGKYFAAGLEDLQVVLNVMMPIILLLIGAYTAQSMTRTWAAAQVEVEQLKLANMQMQMRVESMRAQTGAASVRTDQGN